MKKPKPQEELPPGIKARFQNWGAEGGKTTAQNRTPAERRTAAIKAIRARWERYRARKRIRTPR